MKRYTAVCRRAGGWWAISVPEIKGLHTQARRLDQVEDMTRDAIALMLEVSPDSFEVEVRPEMPEEVTRALQARESAEQAEQRAAQAVRDAITSLRARGYSVRDTGRMLNLSQQRISQIMAGNMAYRKRDRESRKLQDA